MTKKSMGTDTFKYISDLIRNDEKLSEDERKRLTNDLWNWTFTNYVSKSKYKNLFKKYQKIIEDNTPLYDVIMDKYIINSNATQEEIEVIFEELIDDVEKAYKNGKISSAYEAKKRIDLLADDYEYLTGPRKNLKLNTLSLDEVYFYESSKYDSLKTLDDLKEEFEHLCEIDPEGHEIHELEDILDTWFNIDSSWREEYSDPYDEINEEKLDYLQREIRELFDNEKNYIYEFRPIYYSLLKQKNDLNASYNVKASSASIHIDSTPEERKAAQEELDEINLTLKLIDDFIDVYKYDLTWVNTICKILFNDVEINDDIKVLVEIKSEEIQDDKIQPYISVADYSLGRRYVGFKKNNETGEYESNYGYISISDLNKTIEKFIEDAEEESDLFINKKRLMNSFVEVNIDKKPIELPVRRLSYELEDIFEYGIDSYIRSDNKEQVQDELQSELVNTDSVSDIQNDESKTITTSEFNDEDDFLWILYGEAVEDIKAENKSLEALVEEALIKEDTTSYGDEPMVDESTVDEIKVEENESELDESIFGSDEGNEEQEESIDDILKKVGVVDVEDLNDSSDNQEENDEVKDKVTATETTENKNTEDEVEEQEEVAKDIEDETKISNDNVEEVNTIQYKVVAAKKPKNIGWTIGSGVLGGIMAIFGILTVCGPATTIGVAALTVDAGLNTLNISRAIRKFKIKSIAKKHHAKAFFGADGIKIRNYDGSELDETTKDIIDGELELAFNRFKSDESDLNVTTDDLEVAFVHPAIDPIFDSSEESKYFYTKQENAEYNDKILGLSDVDPDADIFGNEDDIKEEDGLTDEQEAYKQLLRDLCEANPWITEYFMEDSNDELNDRFYLSLPNPEDIVLPEGYVYDEGIRILNTNTNAQIDVVKSQEYVSNPEIVDEIIENFGAALNLEGSAKAIVESSNGRYCEEDVNAAIEAYQRKKKVR